MLLHLIDLLFPPRESDLLVRGITNVGLNERLKPRICRLGSGDVTILLRYDEPIVSACVVEAKFHANETAGKALGSALASYLREELSEMRAYEQRACVLVPIPLSAERLREREYNQVEISARHAIQQIEDLSVTLDPGLLVRTRDMLPQTTLDGQARRRNVRGAFGAARNPDPSNFYIVLDDVVTTGATIAEAVRALEHAGAQNVAAFALAH